MTSTATAQEPKKARISPTTQIILGLVIGVITGYIVSITNPDASEAIRPFAQLFIRMIQMIIAPLLFATLVAGIAGAGHFRDVGRMGLRAIIYFEIVTTLALLIGLLAVNIMQPGRRPDAAGADRAAAHHRPAAVVAGDHPAHLPDLGLRRDGARRRAADRHLQHAVRDRAQHARRARPSDRHLVRSAGRDDVQGDAHHHAVRPDRRRRGDRLHHRRAAGSACCGTWATWSSRSTSR